jgi:DNA-binding NtrC family response regulator
MEDIMVVDDDLQYLDLVRQVLECEGIKAYCVTSGEEALLKLKEKTFLLMITDLNMPGTNGIELSREARVIAPHMTIIMSTGDYVPKISQLAKEVGIVKILAKPFNPNEMLEIVKDVVGMDCKNAQLVEAVAKRRS